MNAYRMGQLAGMQKSALSTKQVRRMLRAFKGKALPDLPGLRELAKGVAGGKSVGHHTLQRSREAIRRHLAHGAKSAPEHARWAESLRAGVKGEPSLKEVGLRPSVFRKLRAQRLVRNPFVEGRQRATLPRAAINPTLHPPLGDVVTHESFVPFSPGTEYWRGKRVYMPEGVRKLVKPGELWRGGNPRRIFGVPGQEPLEYGLFKRHLWTSELPSHAGGYAAPGGYYSHPYIDDSLLVKFRDKGLKKPKQWPGRAGHPEEMFEQVVEQPPAKELLKHVTEAYRYFPHGKVVSAAKPQKLSPHSLRMWLKNLGYDV